MPRSPLATGRSLFTGSRRSASRSSTSLTRYPADETRQNAAATTAGAAQAEAMRADGQTVMYVVVDKTIIGLIGVADPIKPTTPEALRRLHRYGIKIVMLTGDNPTTAAAVARRLPVDEIVAEVLPDQKAERIKYFQDQGRVVAMAGDGVVGVTWPPVMP